jgi:hypothetical protein
MGKRKPRTTSPAALTKGERCELRLSKKDKEAFLNAAASQGIPLSLWLRLAAWKVINDHQGKVELLNLD